MWGEVVGANIEFSFFVFRIFSSVLYVRVCMYGWLMYIYRSYAAHTNTNKFNEIGLF